MIIMDMLSFNSDNPSELQLQAIKEDYDDGFKQEIERRNATHQAYADLYMTGDLERLAYHVRKETRPGGGKNWTCIYFILDSDRIPAESKARISSLYPEQKITRLDTEKFSPCIYTGCVTLFMGGMFAYRNTDGCVGRSWECPIVQTYNYPDINDFARILREQGACEAGKTAIERGWDRNYNK